MLFCGLCVCRHVAHPLGLLAWRVGEASHPGPPSQSTAAASPDPWATYNERSRATPSNSGKSNPKAPSRSPWTSCSIDLSQLDFRTLQEPLSMLPPDAFAENATGVVMLTRAMFSSVCAKFGQSMPCLLSFLVPAMMICLDLVLPIVPSLPIGCFYVTRCTAIGLVAWWLLCKWVL